MARGELAAPAGCSYQKGSVECEVLQRGEKENVPLQSFGVHLPGLMSEILGMKQPMAQKLSFYSSDGKGWGRS